MHRERLCACLILFALLGCSEAETSLAPVTLDAEDTAHEQFEVVRPPNTVYSGGDPLLPAVQDCGQRCDVILVGMTKVFGWMVPDAGAAVEGMVGNGKLSFVVGGGSDTIPAPPAPYRLMKRGGDAAGQYAQVLSQAGLVGPSDTIPPAPSPMVFNVNGDALFIFGVDDLVAKKILPKHSPETTWDVTVMWTDGEANGYFPPSDTIPIRVEEKGSTKGSTKG